MRDADSGVVADAVGAGVEAPATLSAVADGAADALAAGAAAVAAEEAACCFALPEQAAATRQRPAQRTTVPVRWPRERPPNVSIHAIGKVLPLPSGKFCYPRSERV